MKMLENDYLIHLIAPKNKDKWDPIWNDCFKFWENSSYNVKLWNDEEDINNLLKEDDLSFFKVLQTLPKIFRIDYAKYLILEKFGGAYFDMDIEIKMNFIPLLNPQRFYLMEASFKVEIVQNSILISLEKNKLSKYFWNTVKNYCKSKVKNTLNICKDRFYKLPSGTNVRETTGPIMLSEVYSNIEFKEDIQLLSHMHFNNTFHDIKICVHHLTNAWNKFKS